MLGIRPKVLGFPHKELFLGMIEIRTSFASEFICRPFLQMPLQKPQYKNVTSMPTPQNWFVYLFLNNWIGKYENRKRIFIDRISSMCHHFLPSLFVLYLTHTLSFCVICLFHFFVAWFFSVQINIILLWWGFSFSIFFCVCENEISIQTFWL